VRLLIALAAVLAICAAVAAQRYGLAIVLVLFLAVAASLGYWAWRVRQSSGVDANSRRGLDD
jgi:hypothetical protein